MDEKELLNQIGEIDDKFVEEAKMSIQLKAHNDKVWIKWMSVAASICIIVAVAVAIAQSGIMTGGKSELDTKIAAENGSEIGESWLEMGDAEIGEVVSTGFGYYVLCEDGKYRIWPEDEVKAENINTGTVVERFITLNELNNTQFEKVTLEETKAVTKEEDGVVTHTPAAAVYNIYIGTIGDEFNDEMAVGLVNTIHSYLEEMSGNKYIKLYVNHQKYLIGGEMPDNGYRYIDVDVMGEEGEDVWADNAEEMVEVTITVKDTDGNPLKNIAYHLEYLSGEKGSYQPGYGITDGSGEFTRKVHPNATYILYLQKRSAVSYTQEIEASIYEEMLVTLNITDAYEAEIVWNKEEVTSVNKIENPTTINITDLYDGDYGEVFLQLFTNTGGQIQLGYAEDTGEYVWNNSVNGGYYLSMQVFDRTKEYDSMIYSKMYLVEIMNGEINIISEIADGDMSFPE